MPRCVGRRASQRPEYHYWQGETLFWIDHSLSPHIAGGLNLVGYNTFTFTDVDEFKDRIKVDDEEIIPWCGIHNAVWVHADDNAKREHKKLLEEHHCRTVWVYRPNGKMSSKDELRALAYCLPRILHKLKKHQHIAIRVYGVPPEHGYKVTPFTL
jgi:hypothetical protein